MGGGGWPPRWGPMGSLFLRGCAAPFFPTPRCAPTGAGIVLISSVRVAGIRVGDRGGGRGEGPGGGDVVLLMLLPLLTLSCQRKRLVLEVR